MLQKTTPEPEEPDPFEDFTAPELCAFVYRKAGKAGLREFLSGAADDKFSTRELYEDAAAALRGVGLAKAAAIVAEAAARIPSQMSFERCPYMEPRYLGKPGNICNIKCWLRSTRDRLLARCRGDERATEEVHKGYKELLRQAGIDLSWGY
ncbi:MAG: hypothetical protein WB689_36575 [Xanthobacteraceae bacterium]